MQTVPEETPASIVEGMTSKKRVRAAHRGSVTRLTGQLQEIVGSGDVCKLKLLRNSQTDKLHILAKLDDELIELVSEEQLEAEGEESDLYREWVGLAIISLDDALKG